jgi:Tfp pilus assembly protein PilW
MLRRLDLGSERGTTLIELLTVLAILLTVLTGIVVGFVSATSSEADQLVRADIQQNARAALETMRRDIHCATAASATPGGTTLVLTQPSGTPCAASTAYSSVTWCALGSSGRYQLMRSTATSGTAVCNAGSPQVADYLSSGVVWPGTVPGCVTGRWPTVAVNIAVTKKGTSLSSKTYTLSDAIALRNAAALCS